MFNLLWRHRASVALVLLVAGLCFAKLSDPDEDDCDAATFLKESGLTYYCLLVARAFTNINTVIPEPQGLPLSFETNLGQTDRQYEYLAHGLGVNVYLSAGAATLEVHAARMNPAVLRASFVGARKTTEAALEHTLPGRVNYFLGNDPDKWITDVPTFRRVRYKDIYPGIDVVYYGASGVLEHDMIVHPGADPAVIRMTIDGADEITLNRDGAAVIRVNGRTIEWKKPVLYQETAGRRHRVEGRFKLEGKELAFETGRYNPARPLVIDPVVSYSSYFGGSAAEGSSHVAADSQGNTYLAGYSRDAAFPITPGAFKPTGGQGNKGNVFVTKVNASGSAVVYSTYIGGAFTDFATGMAVDAAGNVILAGITESEDYPVTAGVVKPRLRNPTDSPQDTFDCLVTKLNASGSALVYSTYLGGRSTDWCSGMTLDSQGNVYVTGSTLSQSAFPVTDNAYQRTNRGQGDAFVIKLNPTATQVIYGTYLGGSDTDSALGIAVDSQGAAYVTGQTASTLGFPVSAGAAQRTYAGSAPQPIARFGDAFAAKLAPDGSALQYLTYLGGRGDDIGFGIAVDPQGNAYITGSTTSQDFPTTAGALQRTYKGAAGNNLMPGGDAFVVKLNPTAGLVYSTYLGGARDDWGTTVAVDSAGNAWLAGATMSSDFPLSTDAFQTTYGGTNGTETFPSGDAWIAQLSANGASLLFSTYVGGAGDEYATSLFLDSAGSAYVTGSTRSANFPALGASLQTAFGGTDFVKYPLGDSFLVKVTGASGGGGSNVSISGVVNNASYAGGGVAPGEIVYVGGTNIGPSQLTNYQIVGGNRLATSLAGVQILFDGQPAPLIYVLNSQAGAIVPYSVAGKSTTQVVVSYNGSRSAPLAVPVLPYQPALFTSNSSGRGQAAVLNQDSSVNSAGNPAAKGSVVQLFGTGEGQTNPAGSDGLLALLQFPKPLTAITVTIAGQTADVLYYGAAPQSVAGLLQVNAKIPESSPSGNVEVLLGMGSARSQSGVTLAVR